MAVLLLLDFPGFVGLEYLELEGHVVGKYVVQCDKPGRIEHLLLGHERMESDNACEYLELVPVAEGTRPLELGYLWLGGDDFGIDLVLLQQSEKA